MHKGKSTFIILTPGFPDSEADVNCLPMQQCFIRNFKKLYPSIDIVVLSFQYPYRKSEYTWKGIKVVSFDGRNKGGIQRILLRNKINSTLHKIKKDARIIGLLSFWYGECALVGHRFAKKNNIKHFCWILGQDAKKENKYPQRVHAGANELVALSDFLQDEFEKNHGIRPQHLIPPGIDPNDFNPAVQMRDIDIIGVGSLIPLKQFDIFIHVIAGLTMKFPSIKAVICGNGPEKNKLLQLIAKGGLENNISLSGERDHAEILSLMQRSKILLHTSSYEGFANVYAEALYAGAHVIGFCRPMKNIFNHQHVPASAEEMVDVVDMILSAEKIDNSPVLVQPIDETCKKFIALFNL